MIVTVTPNAVLDIWYEVDRIIEGEMHFVRRMWSGAGGKGVLVTSVLMGMGYPSLAAGFAGGPPGQTILADLTDRGVPHLFTDVRDSSRRIVTVLTDDGELTRFAEPGPTVDAKAWERLRGTIEPLIAGPATALVVSGRMPVGLAADACVGLLAFARERGVATVVDAGGSTLLEAVSARPDVVKPLLAELREATGIEEPLAAARELQRHGARSVVVTLRPHSLLVVPEEGPVLCAWLPDAIGEPILGMGDALAAAIATGVGREPWEVLARRGVAWAASAGRMAMPGEIDPEDVTRLEPQVQVSVFTGDEVTLD